MRRRLGTDDLRPVTLTLSLWAVAALWLAAGAVSLTAGCHALASEFRCDTKNPCLLGGKMGTCESTGYCTFTDASCTTGRRYDVSAGKYAEACYGTEVGDGTLAIVAGLSGGRGAHADRGALARMGGPQGFAWDGTLLYVSDSYYGVIWTIDADGNVARLAGSTINGGLVDGGYDVAAFTRPNGLLLIGRTLYVADTSNSAVRAIDLDAKQVRTVAILPVNGMPAAPWGITTDGTDLFVTDQVAKGIWRLGTDGTLAQPLFASGFVKPNGIVFSNGEFFVADGGDHTVSRVSMAGVKTKVAGIVGQPGNTTGTTTGRFSTPSGIAMGPDGRLLVADYYGFLIRSVDLSTGEISNFAGTGVNGSNDGTTSQAKLRSPVGVISVDGAVYIAEQSAVRKVAGGQTTTFAGTSIRAGDDDGTPEVATFDSPEAVAVGADGAIYVGDTNNGSVRVIAPDTMVVSTRVTGLNQLRSIAVAGDQLYLGDAGDHTVKRYDLGTSILSTLTSTCGGAMIQKPLGIAVDATANRLYFTDEAWSHVCATDLTTGDTVVVAGTGTAGTTDGPLMQARFQDPHGLAISGQILYVSETRTGTIRRVDLAGNAVTRIAGDAYKRNILAGPIGLAVDGNGSLLIAESEGQRIFKLDPGGPLVSVVGAQGDAVIRTSEPSLVNRPTGLAWSPLLGIIGTSTAENLVFRIR